MDFHSTRSKTKGKKQKQESSWSAAILEDLPLEVSLNILKRLPFTSLLSLKLVCKSWCNLATHPNLSTPHHNQQQHHNTNPYCLVIHEPLERLRNQLYLVDNGQVVRTMNQPMVPVKSEAVSLLSSNGLLCLLLHSYCPSYFTYYRICLYNPLTGEQNILPERVGETMAGKTKEWFFQYFGFGYSPKTSEYKVVNIARAYHHVNTSLHTEVFTLGKKGCQRSEIENPFLCPGQSSDAVVGDAIHWLCKEEEQPIIYQRMVILSFDLLKEKFHRIPNPNCEVSHHSRLSVLGGCLCLTLDRQPRDRIEVHIWLLMEYGAKESWTKKFVIRDDFPVPLNYCVRICPLVLLDSGKIVISYMDEALYSYDAENEVFEAIAETSLVPHRPFKAICHAPSLVSPFF